MSCTADIGRFLQAKQKTLAVGGLIGLACGVVEIIANEITSEQLGKEPVYPWPLFVAVSIVMGVFACCVRSYCCRSRGRVHPAPVTEPSYVRSIAIDPINNAVVEGSKSRSDSGSPVSAHEDFPSSRPESPSEVKSSISSFADPREPDPVCGDEVVALAMRPQ